MSVYISLVCYLRQITFVNAVLDRVLDTVDEISPNISEHGETCMNLFMSTDLWKVVLMKNSHVSQRYSIPKRNEFILQFSP